MTWFRLFLVGENFPFGEGDDRQMMGWYTTRWVEAEDTIEAATKALALLREEPELSDVPSGCGASVTYEEVQEVDESDVPAHRGGFTFFEVENQSANIAKASATT